MGLDGSDIKKRADLASATIRRTSSNLKPCRTCQKTVSKNARLCPHCGEPQQEQGGSLAERNLLHISPALGLVGATILALGVFAPAIRIPVTGNMNFFHNGDGVGIVMLAFAGLTVVLILTKQVRLLWYTGAASMIAIAYTFYDMKANLNAMTADMEAELAGNPFRGLADLAISSIQVQWGWAVVVLGSLLIIAAAAVRQKDF